LNEITLLKLCNGASGGTLPTEFTTILKCFLYCCPWYYILWYVLCTWRPRPSFR